MLSTPPYKNTRAPSFQVINNVSLWKTLHREIKRSTKKKIFTPQKWEIVLQFCRPFHFHAPILTHWHLTHGFFHTESQWIAQHLYLMLSTLSFHIRKAASAWTPAPRRTFSFNVEWMRLEINKIKETKMKCERLLWRIKNSEFFVIDSVAWQLRWNNINQLTYHICSKNAPSVWV